ncbi:sensor histidine kinase [Microbacterium luteolum]|uniref:histidine kinase n=1 Tax=Microbacterium luteolum TaxID=69367 RepID=A0ABY7XSG2_MICLT|nr:sensor histidine kinase [Microbacterium luteolum]WDM45118.1 sensor histidine kinase [Microbacterium luteolum]
MSEPVAVSEAKALAVDLPRPAGAMRRYWGSHPWLVDSLLAAGYLAVGALWAVITPLSSGDWSPIAPILVPLVGAVVSAVALLFRRHQPWVVFGIIGIVALVSHLLDAPAEPFGVGLALYALFVYRSNRSGWIAFGVTAIVSLFFLPASVLFIVGMLVAALLGVTVGDRRRYIGAIVERANQLARERDQQARLATLAERARITREMHDVVAHSVSVMVSLADGAGALAEKDPQRSREAIREIGDVGRQSLVEMRQLMGALGDETADGEAQSPLRPNPGLGELPGLLESFRAAGLPVAMRTQGTPPEQAGLQNAIYRIVQESLTNALRYAREPRHVLVALDFTEEPLTLEVTDDGRAGPPAESVGSGSGLVGIRERVRLYGGTVDAGPAGDGGWRVRVEIPNEGRGHGG